MIFFVLIGLFTGALTGFSGASAVVVVVPALTLFLHLPFRIAVGTSLAVDVITSLVVAWSYERQGNVKLKKAIPLVLGATIGAQTGVILAHYVPTSWLDILFSSFMVILSWNFLFHGWRNIPLVNPPSIEELNRNPSWKMIIGVGAIGFFIGNISGLIGASGGILFLVALMYGLKFPLRNAIGTSTAVMGLSALSGSLGYGWHGEVDITALAVIGSIAVVTGFFVAQYAQGIKERYQIGGTGLLLFVIGLSMLVH